MRSKQGAKRQTNNAIASGKKHTHTLVLPYKTHPLRNHRYISHPLSQPLSPSYRFAHRSLTSILTTLGAAADDGCLEDDDSSSSCKPYSTDWAAFSYFTIACLTLLSCIAGYVVLDRLPITKYYREKAESANGLDDTEEMDEPLLDEKELAGKEKGKVRGRDERSDQLTV